MEVVSGWGVSEQCGFVSVLSSEDFFLQGRVWGEARPSSALDAGSSWEAAAGRADSAGRVPAGAVTQGPRAERLTASPRSPRSGAGAMGQQVSPRRWGGGWGERKVPHLTLKPPNCPEH